MQEPSEIFDLVERYERGRMSASERLTLEKRYTSDEVFAAEADAQMIALRLMDEVGDQALKAELTAMLAEKPQGRTVLMSQRNWYLAAAAGVLLLLGTWVIYTQTATLSPNELYAAHFDLPAVSNIRDTETPTETAWNEALGQFRDKQFVDASQSLTALLNDPAFTHTSEAHLYLGISSLALDKTDEAISQLALVAAQSTFSQDASWYTALAYLKAEELEKAMTAFEAVANDETHYRHKEARKILEEDFPAFFEPYMFLKKE